jgi:hypothetical protein
MVAAAITAEVTVTTKSVRQTAFGLSVPALGPFLSGSSRYLDLWTYPQYIAGTCCRPVLTDIRRGFKFSPNNRARLAAHPSREGWALDGCSDSLNSTAV